jgi:hypothetical protein
MTTKSNHYIDNKRFVAAINEFHERRKNNPDERIPDEIGKCFILMSERLASRYNFAMYTYRDEFVSDGILRCVEVFKSFDPTKSTNPFAYFTKVLYRVFITRIRKEKQQRQVRDQLIMYNDIFCLQEGDDCPITRDQVIGDYQFDSSNGDS